MPDLAAEIEATVGPYLEEVKGVVEEQMAAAE
jgi:hypothetical protein